MVLVDGLGADWFAQQASPQSALRKLGRNGFIFERLITDTCATSMPGRVSLLTGRPPFQAKSLPKLLEMQRNDKPDPVRRFAPSIPVELERIIMQLLEKWKKEK